MSIFFVEFLHRLGFTEILKASVLPPNFFATFLLGFCITYWLLVILGALDFSFLNFDVEIELEADTEIEANTEIESESGEVHAVSWWNGVLSFFNIGKIPFTIFLTLFTLPFWLISIFGNHYFNNSSFVWGLLIMIPAFFISLFISKVFTTPFVFLFRKLDSEESSEEIQAIGKVCTVLFNMKTNIIAQAEIVTEFGHSRINVFATEEIKKGQTALVIEYSEEKRGYLISPYETTI